VWIQQLIIKTIEDIIMKINYGKRSIGVIIVALGAWFLRVICLAADLPKGPIDTIGKTPLEKGWKAITITGGLMHPWSAAWLPDGKTMLVTEREGRLRVVRSGKLQMDPVKGLPNVLPMDQGGLLDIALHPDFKENRMVYLTYSSGSRLANRTALARGRINEKLTELTDVKKLFQVSQAKQGGQHFGSRLLWLDDGTLLMSVGDGGNPPLKLNGRFIRLNAQDLSSQLGKILRLDENGKPPADNPFADDGDSKTDPYIWSYGHRNIQGLGIDPKSREVWATEHGARGGDELNIIRKGQNYGWPKATYSVEYFGPRISDRATLEEAIDPAVVWTPCIAPSGLMFYTGPEFPGWQGDLLAGGLVLRQIRRIDFEDDKIVGQTTLQFEDRIRWVGQGPDGGIYVLTDEVDGKLLRIVPQE
jgi:glucose/arabinose dehydrogenase